jgi:hypothetical protein
MPENRVNIVRIGGQGVIFVRRTANEGSEAQK